MELDYWMTDILSGQMAIDEAFEKLDGIRVDYRDKELKELRRKAIRAVEDFGTAYLHRKTVARSR